MGLSITLIVLRCAFLIASILSSLAQTTPYINQVFVGKCYERNPMGVNCTEIWDAFASAATLGNNVVNDTDYAPFFAIANFSTPRDNTLFWSGNQAFAMAIANDGTRYTTIEETPTGYILNGLNWCGVPGASPPQFDYTTPCVYPSNATYYGTQGVWAQCSKYFAQAASGHINIFLQPARLNYDSGPFIAYRNTSVFYQIELPNLNKSIITNATILLITNTTANPDEVCGKGSLVNLTQDLVKKLGVQPNCIDDPQKIYSILCPDDSTQTAQCLAATLAYSDSDRAKAKDSETFFIWAVGATGLSVLLLFSTVYFAMRAKSKRSDYDKIRM